MNQQPPPFAARTSNPAPFVSPGVPKADLPVPDVPPLPDPTAAVQPNVDDGSQGTKRGDSAASMVTEILSAAPRMPESEPTETPSPMLAEDVTIMAKGRRRRFRLR